jgi:hypothetical protein
MTQREISRIPSLINTTEMIIHEEEENPISVLSQFLSRQDSRFRLKDQKGNNRVHDDRNPQDG